MSNGEEIRAAMVTASVGRALIRAMGLSAQNQINADCGSAYLYGKDDFDKIIEEEGLGHNSIISTLYPR